MFNMHRRLVVLLTVGVAVLALVACEANKPATPTVSRAAAPAAMMEKTSAAAMSGSPDAMMQKTPETMMGDSMMKLPDQQFAAHFVSSDPAHGAKLVQQPGTLTLTFNFTLNETSTVAIKKDDKAVALAKPSFTGKKLAMSVAVPAGTGGGLYVVDYKACWPDNSCHNGKFGFTVS